MRVPWPFSAAGFPTLLPHEQITWTRLRHHDFRCWHASGSHGCVHNCGLLSAETPRHVFWDCDTARVLWKAVVGDWSHEPGDLPSWTTEIFSGTLGEPRLDVWPVVRDHVLRRLPRAAASLLDLAAAQLYMILNQLWRLHVTVAFQSLWSWRLRKIHEGCRLGSVFLIAQVRVAFSRRARIHLAAVRLGGTAPTAQVITLAMQALVAAVCDGALVTRLPTPPPAVDCHVLLL